MVGAGGGRGRGEREREGGGSMESGVVCNFLPIGFFISFFLTVFLSLCWFTALYLYTPQEFKSLK